MIRMIRRISVLIVTLPIFNIIVPSCLPKISFDVRELRAKLKNKRKPEILLKLFCWIRYAVIIMLGTIKTTKWDLLLMGENISIPIIRTDASRTNGFCSFEDLRKT
jgi:hypothetical protein